MRQLTHDVRNDLNVLELELTLLEEAIDRGAAQPKDLAGMRASIRKSETRLRKLFVRLQPVAPVLTRTSLAELMDNLRELAERAGYLKDADAWKVEPVETAIQADVDAISDAILEILENASNHRQPGKNIAVRATLEAGTLKISVAEEKSHRPPNLETWDSTPFVPGGQGAYGLGLNYAARIVSAHHGQVARRFDEATQVVETTVSIPVT